MNFNKIKLTIGIVSITALAVAHSYTPSNTIYTPEPLAIASALYVAESVITHNNAGTATVKDIGNHEIYVNFEFDQHDSTITNLEIDSVYLNGAEIIYHIDSLEIPKINYAIQDRLRQKVITTKTNMSVYGSALHDEERDRIYGCKADKPKCDYPMMANAGLVA